MARLISVDDPPREHLRPSASSGTITSGRPAPGKVRTSGRGVTHQPFRDNEPPAWPNSHSDPSSAVQAVLLVSRLLTIQRRVSARSPQLPDHSG